MTTTALPARVANLAEARTRRATANSPLCAERALPPCRSGCGSSAARWLEQRPELAPWSGPDSGKAVARRLPVATGRFGPRPTQRTPAVVDRDWPCRSRARAEWARRRGAQTVRETMARPAKAAASPGWRPGFQAAARSCRTRRQYRRTCDARPHPADRCRCSMRLTRLGVGEPNFSRFSTRRN